MIEPKMPRCCHCGETDVEKLRKNLKRPSGYGSLCKSCHNDYMKKWKAANPDKVWTHNFTSNQRARGQKQILSVEEYEQMIDLQGGVCGLCGLSFDEKSAPAIDHDHQTGMVRGILHNRCNKAIGFLKENAELCRKAAVYLEKAALKFLNDTIPTYLTKGVGQ